MKIQLLPGRRKIQQMRWNPPPDWAAFIIVPSTTMVVALISWMGLIQTSEWFILDRFFRWRPLEPPDRRILVVTINDEDITRVGTWPISDQHLARVLSNLKAQKPRAVGLDLYRDLPVEPGHRELTAVFQTMPNLIGVQFGLNHPRVPAPPVLAKLKQVADTNIPEDPDKRVRRAMLTGDNGKQTVAGLGLALALKYLEQDNIRPIALPGSPETYQLGKARFDRLQGHDGGYVDIDDRGYQVLLNFRGTATVFQTISFTDVLHNRFPGHLVRDRVVLLGTTAESVKDIFLTPYSDNQKNDAEWMSGLLVHANITSQILSAALDGRPLLRGLPGAFTWIWFLTGAAAGVVISWQILQTNWINKQFSYIVAIFSILVFNAGVVAVGYLFFLQGWWVPVATSMLALNGAAIACFAYYSYKLQCLAYIDSLTQVANRRYFDLCLAEHIQRKGNLSLILCDVDYFKLYNDTYGHQAGDECLRSVAQTLKAATRRSDFLARYGGEEFAVILPNTTIEEAAVVAERIINQLRALQLPHQASTAAPYVTLSCGVANVTIDDPLLKRSDWSGIHLLVQADKALYRSKHEGRDRFTMVAL